jgi:branched-chain amino acid transport system permease protein
MAAALVPMVSGSLGPVLPGSVNSIGSMTLLSMMMVHAALAITLYLLVGVSGVLTFGHGLYFALGVYISVIVTNTFEINYFASGAIAVVASAIISTFVNGLALKAGIVGYSMITLAFAEIMALAVGRGFLNSGGDTGVTLDDDLIPNAFRGLANTPRLFWLSLALLVVIYASVWFLERRTKFGHVWISIRENELRTEMLGYNVYGYKLVASVIASTMASICGVIYGLVVAGAQPDVAKVLFCLGLVVMVILGGRNVIWGALIGGLLHTYLNLRLPALIGAHEQSSLPRILEIPLSEPDFFIGICFVLVILFLPNGIASLFTRNRRLPLEPG